MKLNHTVKGSGRNIVLLHGWQKGASSKSMDKLQDELVKRGFKVWALDLPGFGKSDPAPSHWGVSDYAEAISTFISSELQDTSYDLFGHSFGGSLTAYIAAHLEPKPEKIILCSTSGLRYKTLKAKLMLPVSKVIKVFLKLLPNKLRKRVRKIIYYYVVGERDYIDSEEKAEQFRRVTNEDLTETFKLIKIPTLIIWGKDDKVTPVSMGETIQRLIQGSRFKIVEGRHGIPMTQPEKVAELIEKLTR